MNGIESQLRTVFRRVGMNPREIEHNENNGYWKVSVQTEGTDDEYLRDVTEIGAAGPTGKTVNFQRIKSMRSSIDETGIPAGTIRVDGFESEYFKIRIEDS